MTYREKTTKQLDLMFDRMLEVNLIDKALEHLEYLKGTYEHYETYVRKFKLKKLLNDEEAGKYKILRIRFEDEK